MSGLQACRGILSARGEQMEDFDVVIVSKKGWFDIDFKELWRYRDLILLFVNRNFISLYKQTILGPAWAIIQPLLTTVIFTVVFGCRQTEFLLFCFI